MSTATLDSLRDTIAIALTVCSATAFFFIIIGVFGLNFAISGTVLAIVVAVFIFQRSQNRGDV